MGKLTGEQIVAALEAGEYKIEYEESCGCSFDWRIGPDGLRDDGLGEDCWTSRYLYIGDQLIAWHDRFEAPDTAGEVSWDDIPDSIRDQMCLPDVVEQGEIVNHLHRDRLRESLVEFIEGLLDKGYTLGMDDERGFANEYTCLLGEPGADLGGNDWRKDRIGDWVDAYLYDGDAATQAYNGFRLVEAAITSAAAILGRKGGSVRSEAKTAANRAKGKYGKMGGRPKKEKAK